MATDAVPALVLRDAMLRMAPQDEGSLYLAGARGECRLLPETDSMAVPR